MRKGIFKSLAVILLFAISLVLLNVSADAMELNRCLLPKASGENETKAEDKEVREDEEVKEDEESFSLTILYNNDTHGVVDSLPYFKTLIDEAREEVDNILVLHGGDIFLRGEFEALQGVPEMEMMNAIGYDAWVLGNNDFRIAPQGGTVEAGNEQVQNMIAMAEFPTLCANVTMRQNGKTMDNVYPYIIKEVGGVNVAIIGVTSLKPQYRLWTEVADKNFESGEITVANTIEKVSKEADIILVLSHAGLVVDMQISRVGGVTAVIGADDHLVIQKPLYYPGYFGAKSTPMVQAGGENEQYLGRLELNFGKTEGKWTLAEFDGYLYDLEGVEADQTIVDIIEEYRNNAAEEKEAA